MRATTHDPIPHFAVLPALFTVLPAKAGIQFCVDSFIQRRFLLDSRLRGNDGFAKGYA